MGVNGGSGIVGIGFCEILTVNAVALASRSRTAHPGATTRLGCGLNNRFAGVATETVAVHHQLLVRETAS
jgi:hypothetical protein